jgi:hypothetical protein
MELVVCAVEGWLIIGMGLWLAASLDQENIRGIYRVYKAVAKTTVQYTRLSLDGFGLDITLLTELFIIIAWPTIFMEVEER